MTWSITRARQQLPEVVRLAVQAPQLISKRGQPVAGMLSPEDFEEFRMWRETVRKPSLVEQFERIRAALIAEGFEDGIEVPPRTTRPSPFDDPDWDK